MAVSADPIAQAAAAAGRGELIVVPTDTVYGIGTRPDDAEATQRVFRAKGRPRDLELPILVATVRQARWVTRFDDRAERLAARCWPGALTLVLPRAPASRAWELGGDPDTLAVRVPHHPLALAVLAASGPLAITSANRSGDTPATTCDELTAVFGDAVAVYLCQDEPLQGEPSTVVDLAHGRAADPAGRRCGRGSPEPIPGSGGGAARLAALTMTSILVVCTGNVCRSPIAEGLLRNVLMARVGEAAPAVSLGWDGGLARASRDARSRDGGRGAGSRHRGSPGAGGDRPHGRARGPHRDDGA